MIAGCGPSDSDPVDTDDPPFTDTDTSTDTDTGSEEVPLLDLLAGVDESTAWADLDPALQEALAAAAEEQRVAYRAEWGPDALSDYESALVGAPTAAMDAQFDAYVAAMCADVVPSGFSATTDVGSPELQAALRKLYLLTWVEYRSGVWAGLGLAELDWDSVSAFGDGKPTFGVADPETRSGFEAYGEAVLADIHGLTGMDGSDEALREKAVFYARSLATEGYLFGYGGDSLVTSYNIALWSGIPVYAYAYGGIGTSEDAIRTVNAMTFADLQWVNVGTVGTLVDYELPSLLDDYRLDYYAYGQ